jgi:L-lactate utilization protein LutB
MMLTTIENLRKNGFEVIEVATADEALEIAKGFVEPQMHIGLGGSTTVQQIGLLAWLTEQENIQLSNQYEAGITMEENLERRRQGMISDLYVTGCNAITQKGELVNADGDGNRVAAQIFGPKKVLLIASKNKIVESVKEGFGRIRGIAAPKNIERMNAKAVSMGKEPHYNNENIANKFVFITADKPGRTTIIIVGEELGY